MSLTAPSGPTTRRVGASGTQLAELIWHRSLTAADRTYLRHARTARTISFADLRRVSVRWAALLDDLGVGPGDAVGLAVSDPLDFAVVFLSTMAAGRVAAPLDPAAPDPEVAAVCARVGPQVVVADRPAPDGAPCEWLMLPRGSFELAPDRSAGRPSSRPPVSPPAGIGGLVLSTSGTTGTPKLIRLTERRLLFRAGAIAAHHQLSVIDRGFSPLPLFHINAEVVGLLSTLVAGAGLVVDDRFHRTDLWALLDELGVTWVNAVPAIISRLVPLRPGETVPERLRFVRSASAPLPPSTLARFEGATGLPVVETYGMTEAASQITANPVSGPRKAGSVGVPVGIDLRVVGGDEGRLAPGEVGRVQIRGPGVIAGYDGSGYEDRFDDEGWLATGDLGTVDVDGYLFLVGREDDVINRGGEKILPREVEDVVAAEPAVTTVAVVGWDHAELGRVPVAYLVVEGVRGATDRDLAQEIVGRVAERCARSLSKAKRPVAYHVVEHLPVGATGKVRRSHIEPASTVYSLLVS